MNDDLGEIRYPFYSGMEFFTNKYFFDIQAIHLVFAYLWLIFTIIYIYRISNKNLIITCFSGYFSLSIYNNYCFLFFGLSIAEWIGLLGICLYAFSCKLSNINLTKFSISFIAVVSLFLVHAMIVWLLNPELVSQNVSFLERLTVFGKPVILLMLSIIVVNYKPDLFCKTLPSAIMFSVVGACIVYLMQFFESRFTQIVPYGTFEAAGFSGAFSFGGTSIERGHFAKFLVPFLPILLYWAAIMKKFIPLIIFIIVCLLNFSASGYVFFWSTLICCIIISSRYYNWRQLRNIFLLLFVSSSIFISIYSKEILSIFEKIYQLAILGDETEQGGRSFGVFRDYILEYPFGMGFSGSAFRNLPNLTEINSGLSAFFAQTSIVGLIVVFPVAYMWYAYIKKLLINVDAAPNCYLIGGVMVMPLIFISDILWFVPSVWASFFILYAMQFSKKTIEID